MELRERRVIDSKQQIQIKLNKKLIINYLQNNHLSPAKFCELNRINTTMFKLLMQKDSFIQKESYLSAIIRIARGTNSSILDLLLK